MHESETGRLNPILKSVEGQRPSLANVASRLLGTLLSRRRENFRASWRVRDEAKPVTFPILERYKGSKLQVDTTSGAVLGVEVTAVNAIPVAVDSSLSNSKYVGNVRFDVSITTGKNTVLPVTMIFFEPNLYSTKAVPMYGSVDDFENSHGAEKTVVEFSETLLKQKIAGEINGYQATQLRDSVN